MKIERCEHLEILKEAHELSKKNFEIKLTTPFLYNFKFRDQIRSSYGSRMDNIAKRFE
jgi:hypothetical protein